MKNLCSELQEHQSIALENSQKTNPTRNGRQYPARFSNYCRSNGHTPNWCRQRMQNEEIQRVQYDMSFKKNVAPIWDCRTSDFNRKSQYGQDRDRPPDSIDGNNPTIELLTTEGDSWHNESNKLLPNEPRFISRIDGMSFNMAQFTNSPQLVSLMMRCPTRSHLATNASKVFYIFGLQPSHTCYTLISLNSVSLRLTLNLISIIRSQSTVIRLRLKNLSTAVVSQITWDL